MEDHNTKIKELYSKHHILTDGFKRVYWIGLWEKKFDMEKATPIELLISMPDPRKTDDPKMEFMRIESRSWTKMITLLVERLQKHNPKPLEEMYSFRTKWSSQVVFSHRCEVVNMKQVADNLFVNVGHTANHLLWLCQDIIEFYIPKEVDNKSDVFAVFLVHRPPFSEPQEVINELELLMKLMFRGYLYGRDLPVEKIEKVLKGIDSLNYLLTKTGSSYNNFYLIDSTQMYSTYKSKLLQDLPRYVTWNDAQIALAKKCLDYLGSFLLMLERNARGKELQ